jgi:hypothetical protein
MASSIHFCVKCAEFNRESSGLPLKKERLIENSDLSPYEDRDLPFYDCDLKAAYRECGSKPHEFILCLEYKGPKDAKISFSPVFPESSRTCLFISVVKETQEEGNCNTLVKAKFDLSDPKYALFLEKLSSPTFKIRFIDSNLHFEDLILTKPN